MQRPVWILCIVIFHFVLFAPGARAEGLYLDKEYSITLEEKDRVLGSLRGNYAVYGRPDLTLYDKGGREIFSRTLKNNVKPTLSPEGRYLALVTYADRSPTDLKTVKLEMFDSTGAFLWQMAKPSANTFHITDKGTIFGIEGVKGIPPTRIHLYDQYGTLLNILIYKEFHGIKIAPSGGKFILDKARGGLDVYDSLGVLLFDLPVSEMYVFDTDDRYVGVFFQGLFRLYQDGEEVVQIKTRIQTLRDMAINVEEDLLVMMGVKRLEVYELVSRNMLWEYALRSQERSYSSLDVSPDGRLIACGIDVNAGTLVPKDKRHVEGYLFIFPRDGEKIVRHRVSYDLWGISLPKGVFSKSGDEIILQTRELITRFDLR